MKENQKRDIVKSNALVEACYQPKSLNQMRLLLAALTQVRANQELSHETEFTVSAGALSDLTGTNLQASYKALKRAADELMGMNIGVDILPNGRKGKPLKAKINVVSQCVYQKDEGSVVLNFTHHIIPYISELSSHFTAYKTKILMNLKNRYGIRLYELCLQWIPFGLEREIEVDTFRKIFGLSGKYQTIAALKRRVVFPAVDDVNQHTDLNIRFDQVKSGRAITHFQFVITKKKGTKKKVKRQHPKAQPHPALLSLMAAQKEGTKRSIK